MIDWTKTTKEDNELIRKVKFKNYLDALEKIESYIYHYNYERPHQGLDGVRLKVV